MRGRLLAAAAVALMGSVVLLAGCGGGGTLSKADYEQKLKADGQAVKAAFAQVTANPSSLDALAKQVAKAQDATKKAADDLGGIKPPKDAEADNAKLVKALQVIADEMGKLKDAADKGDAQAAARVSAELDKAPALQQAQAATQDLKSKGYAIGAFGQ